MTDAAATWFGGRTVPIASLVPVALFANVPTRPIGANDTNGTRLRYSERRKRTLAAVHDHLLSHPNKPATGTNDAIGTGYGYGKGRMSIAATARDRYLHRSGAAPTGTNDAIGTGYLSQPQALRTGRVVRRGPQVSRIGWAIGTNGTIGTEIQIEAYGASIVDRAALNSAGLLVTAPLGGKP